MYIYIIINAISNDPGILWIEAQIEQFSWIVKKDKFWIPKYVADAYDGKVLWLLIDEEEILGKYHHGSEPPGDQYARDFEAFKTTPYGQKATYNPDSDQNVRVVEEYKNVRDLK